MPAALEIEPGFFRAPDGFVEAAFREGSGGRTHLYLSTAGPMGAEKVRLRESAGLHLALFAFAILLAAAAIIFMIQLNYWNLLGWRI